MTMNAKFWLAWISVLGMFALGCAQDDPIVTYRVLKDRSGLEQLRGRLAREAAENTQGEQRMLVAMFEQGQEAWFFKVLGPADRVEQAEPACQTFFNEIKFVEGQPKWNLPDGWTEGPKRPMRLATLVIDPKPPAVEMAISSLAAGQDLLLNANRWRGQLGLAPVTSDTLETAIRQVKGGAGPYYLFDATGKGSGKMSRAPFAPFANSGAGGNTNSNQASGAAPQSIPSATLPVTQPDLTYDLPEGWQAGASSRMIQVKLEKTRKGSDDKGLITAISMPADRNTWAPNVSRWAGQVGMELSAEQAAEMTESVTIDGLEGQLIRLIDDQKPTSLIAVMIKRGDAAWFFKLSGSRDMVKQEAQTFEQFMDSIKFKQSP